MSTEHELTDRIRTKARELLQNGGRTDDPGPDEASADAPCAAIGCFIGYEEGTRGRVRPAFVYDAQDVDRLIWDDRCAHNLTTYLSQVQGAARRREAPLGVGILVKPCDSRSLNVLLHEKQVERDQMYVIGLTCEGIQVDGQTPERCRQCAERVPVVYDLVMGQVPRASGARPADQGYADVGRLDAMSPQERLALWSQEFDRCIRCYACRQACPACYCVDPGGSSECVAEQLDPSWMGIAIDLPQKRFFHVMRAYHLAGRCSGCNACEEACPMGIPLSLLNRKVAREVETLFGYRAGQDATMAPPLATFRREEQLPM
jgi:ferredoxin